MSGRLLLGVALVAKILVLVVYTAQTASASSVSSASASSYAFSSSSVKAVHHSRPVKCRKDNRCPENEEFSYCIKSIQRPQYCSEKEERCKARANRGVCKEGCVCKKNYLRAANGTCIRAARCPITCGDNEIVVTCPTDCVSDNCPTEETEPRPCVMPDFCPRPACRCAFNHRRALNGSCIPTRDCPPFDCSCRPNEKYNPCPPICPTDDCSQASPTGECPRRFGRIGIVLPCNPKCRCIKGYWRLDGICVPYGQCPGVCPDNERYSGCIQGECRALNCTQKDQSVPCVRMDPKYCIEGCVCEEGYLRNQDGICVLEDDCEPEDCPDNERYSGCIQGECRALNCTQKDQPVRCVKIDPKYCIKGCVCEEGYLRNQDGICVLEDQCKPEDCPDNERYSACIQAECRALECTEKDQPVVCVRMDPKYCIKECVCNSGYLRNQDGICVLEDDCEPPSCPANEEFVQCMQGVCRAKDCSQRGEDVPCPDIPTEKCDSGCICKEKFLRAENGSCLPENECESGECPNNERYSGCIQSECRALNCTQKDQSVPCVDIDQKDCIQGCVCEKGYLRNQDGICVLEDDCEPCGENEVLEDCPMACNSDYCPKSADEEEVCVKMDPCVPTCKCRFNYKRAENGTCIPTTECPPFDCCGKPNEEFVACPPICPSDECGRPRLEGRCPFRIGIVLQCNPACQCKDGYGRLNGTCVPFEECPGLCPDNETYSGCIQGECRALNCTQKDQSVPCVDIDQKDCIKGCVCEKGYLRNQDGICVLEDDCEPRKCPDNEIYSGCRQTECRALNCTQKDKPVHCFELDPKYCIKGCICEEGYLRNQYGVCVLEDECELCPDNERFSECIQGECRALNCNQRNQSVPCVRLDQRVCLRGCFCIPGYLRNKDGVCVLEDQCEPGVCSDNERYSECKQAECRALRCTQKGQSVPCFDIDPQFCIKGCVCEEGYLANQYGICVLEEECKPPVCPSNEEWSTCAQATCRAQNCTQRGKPIACPSILYGYCEEACVCKEGYLRNADGDCIPEEQCPCGENEVLEDCPMSCSSEYCPRSADEEEVCVQMDPCVPTCKCRFNYKRADNGTCIPTTECPPFDCSGKPNEEFVACPPSCPGDECGRPRLEGRCPYRIGVVLQCNPTCQCKDGYGRLNGTCVPFEECPDLCRVSEEYSSCMQRICRPQKCSDGMVMEACATCDDASCQRGCVCKENFYRNDIGICVPYEACGGPMCPYAHEVLEPEFKECPPNICRSLVSKFACDENQKVGPGCLCESGYLRLSLSSPCIPICDCPEMANSPDSCGENEVLDDCPVACNSDYCLQTIDEEEVCVKTDPCVPTCKCRLNYKRADNGTCIPATECPDLCPAHEVYSSCVQRICRPQNCSDRDVAMETCSSCDDASCQWCQRGCVCRENFYRNGVGDCVSYDTCEGPLCPYAHEVYTPNYRECPPNICNSLVAKYACKENQKMGPGCLCESGYLRLTLASPCIPICDCPEMANSPDC